MQFIKHHTALSVLLLVVFLAVAFVLYPVFVRQRGSRIDTCAAHLSLLGVALQAYAADYDGRLPNALTWPEDLRPYFQDQELLHCPEDTRQGERSYEMLQRWGGQRLPEAKAHHLILLYEIGKYGLEYRHYDGIYLGHGDGHVKWYRQEKMTPETILGGLVPVPEAEP